MNKAYEQEIEMWNQVFKECTPVDLRKLDLKVETMFDEALKLFLSKDIYEVNELTKKLNDYNKMRQEKEKSIYEEKYLKMILFIKRNTTFLYVNINKI